MEGYYILKKVENNELDALDALEMCLSYMNQDTIREVKQALFNAGFIEEQNEAEARINDTPRIKPQISVSSAEKAFSSNYELIIGGEVEANSVSLQRTAEKNYLLPQSLGTSDVNSEYVPSWSVRFLNGGLTGSVNYLNLKESNGGINTLLIPQIESAMKIRYDNIDTEAPLISDETESGMALSDLSLLSS